VTLRLPLTLAIIDGLLVSAGDTSFVAPLASTLECVELTREDIERANDKHMATCAGKSFRTLSCENTSAFARTRPANQAREVAKSSLANSH